MKEKKDRNRLFYELHEMGVSFAQIGKKRNLSRQAVRAICLREKNKQEG